jgi:hypothetical protein
MKNGFFEVGDRVELEIHRGSWSESEGISVGGSWRRVIGIVDACRPDIGFCALRDESGRHLQVISPIPGVIGYPYRGASIVEARS